MVSTRRHIPSTVIGALSELVSLRETHDTLNSLFSFAGAPGEPPQGSKHAKVSEWLRRTNQDNNAEPLRVLGRILENYLEEDLAETQSSASSEFKRLLMRLNGALERSNLVYVKGGLITNALGSPSRYLEDYLRNRNMEAVNEEFDRAVTRLADNPKEAVSAACNILEATCKIYIEDEGLTMPAKKDLIPVWNVVRKHLGWDPAIMTDRDVQEVLSGLSSVVGGVASLRTHGSSAHGQGRKRYQIECRHARLAVHAAHTIVLFILETWEKKRSRP